MAQGLLLPETVSVPCELLEQASVFEPVLRKLGINCEPFGEDCLIVRSVPALLQGTSASVILSDLFSLAEGRDWKTFLDQQLDAVVARLACHSAVRAGQDLKAQEVYQLVKALEEAESSAFCPHGRPVAVFLSMAELEQMFGRRM